jgi:hypothetical protein
MAIAALQAALDHQAAERLVAEQLNVPKISANHDLF